MLHVILAKMRGAYVIVSEMDEKRAQKALAMGADKVINPANEDAVSKVKEYSNGIGADVVVNAIASPKIWNDAIAMLAPYGRLLAYSSQDSKELIGVDMDKLHSKEYEFIGTVSPSMASNLKATKLIEQGLIDMEQLIDGRYDMENCKEAFEKASTPNTYRVIIKMS